MIYSLGVKHLLSDPANVMSRKLGLAFRAAEPKGVAMANVVEWMTNKFEEPLPILLFLLGALLLLLGVTTGLEVPVLKQLTPDLKYRWVSIMLGCALLLLATRIYYMPVVRHTWYGIEITSLAKDGSAVCPMGDLRIIGKYKRLPRKKFLYLINASHDKIGFCPQVGHSQQIEVDKNGTWRGSTYVNQDTRIIVATVSPVTLALFNYYKKVGEKTGQWVEIDRLPDPPDYEKQDEVSVRCK
jgi:hypothetical protein